MALLSKVDGRWINEEKPTGVVFFVSGGTDAYTTRGAPKGASDGNDGLDPTRPLATIDGTYGAIAKCVAGRGDTIVVLPGTVTITAAIGLDKADVTLTGYTCTGPKTRNPSIISLASGTDLEMLDVDAANVVVENLTFVNTATSSAAYVIDVGDTTASPGFILRNLYIDNAGAEDTATSGIRVGDGTLVSDYGVIEGCVIFDNAAEGITVSDVSEGCRIQNCDIFGQSQTCGTCINLDADHSQVIDCLALTNGAANTADALTIGAGATEVFIRDSTFIAFAGDEHAIQIENTGSGNIHHCFVSAKAAADGIEFLTGVTGISGVIAWQSAPADGTICELVTPTTT